jgi:hypothetical protein
LGEDGLRIVTQLINNIYEWLQVSDTKLPRNALFWVTTQRVAVFLTDVSGQRIGPILRFQDSKRKPVTPIRSFYREVCGR